MEEKTVDAAYTLEEIQKLFDKLTGTLTITPAPEAAEFIQNLPPTLPNYCIYR